MTPDETRFNERIHQVALTVPGVATVYPADPAWHNALRQAGAVLNLPGDGAARFAACTLDEATATVRVRIGVTRHAPAPQVARDVAAAIRALLERERPGTTVRTQVQVCSISEHDEPAMR